MSSKRMLLSPTGKIILERFIEMLSLTRSQLLKIAFSKGIVSPITWSPDSSSDKRWEIPDIFSTEELLLFKHLIINKLETEESSLDIYSEILKHIESGLIILDQLYNERNSLDDLRMLVIS